MKEQTWQNYFFTILILLITLYFWILPPIPQSFHSSLDTTSRHFFSSFLDSCSGFLLIVIGYLGAIKARKKRTFDYQIWLTLFITTIFSGFVILLNFSLNENLFLLLYRLFTSIFLICIASLLINQHVDKKNAKEVIFVLISFGIFSVFYWSYTEFTGHGDLRLYIALQALSLFLILFVAAFLPQKVYEKSLLFYFISLQLLAKTAFFYNLEIMKKTNYILTGESMQLLLISIATIVIFMQFRKLNKSKA